MAINDEYMKKYTSEYREASEAKRLYTNNLVIELEVSSGEPYWGHQDTIQVHAVVYESRKPYVVDVILNEQDYPLACRCNCARAPWGLCRHAGAALYRFQFLRKNGEITRPTSGVAKKLIQKISYHGFQDIMTKRDLGTVRLVPRILLSSEGAKVDFKIGNKRLYVIKDLVAFADACHKKQTVSYGKELEVVHDDGIFTEDSQPLYEFIMAHMELYRTMLSTGRFYGSEKLREFAHSESDIYKLFALLLGQTIDLQTAYDKGLPYTIVEQDFKLNFYIEKVPKGVLVYRDSVICLTGRDHLYKIDREQNKICRCSKEMKSACEPLLNYIPPTADNAMYLAEKDVRAFCGAVVPIMEQFGVLQEINMQVAQYMPEECSIRFYLDAPAKEMITCKPVAVYGDDQFSMIKKIDTVQHYRDVKKETEAMMCVNAYMGSRTDDGDEQIFFVQDDERLFRLVERGIEELQQYGEVYVSDALKRVKVQPSRKMSVGVSVKSDLLELEVDTGELPLEELMGLLSAYRQRKNYYRLKSGDFIQLEDSNFSLLADMVDVLNLSAKELLEKKITVGKYRALYLDRLFHESGGNVTLKRDSYFKNLIRDMKTVEDSDYEVPDSLGSVLREYQKTGYRWLRTLETLGFGGILADDMGLGKTIQVIAYLLSMKDESRTSLIVCPASLVFNWEQELERFAPELKVMVLVGTAKVRKEAFLHLQEYDVVITSYDLLKRDVDEYDTIQFHTEIIDEAQYIKNQNTQVSKAVKLISSKVRFALTGTPVENRLSELWSIFDYLMPGLLYQYSKFKKDFETPIVNNQDEKTILQLQRMVRPFILRRLKKDVLKDLPEKLEEVVYAKAESEQWKLYQAYTARLRSMIASQSESEVKTNKLEILAGLTRLRQLCCDPALVYEDYKASAAKLEVCLEIVENAVASDHKILIFSQFTTMLERISAALHKKDISHFTLTGATPKATRADMVKRFQSDDTKVFLISLKAGGTGLNLTAADIVIHFDPWWNMAAQNQATDRVHRIGQKNMVTVYKLIMKNSIEEKILKLQENKMQLADQIVSGEGMATAEMSKEELISILS